MNQLRYSLISDLEQLGLPIDFKLDIRGYSKTYNGRYDPNKDLILLYALESDGSFRPYEELLEIVVHEAVHHYQWKHQEDFVRLKGVMHNTEFWSKYNQVMTKAKLMIKSRELIHSVL